MCLGICFFGVRKKASDVMKINGAKFGGGFASATIHGRAERCGWGNERRLEFAAGKVGGLTWMASSSS